MNFSIAQHGIPLDKSLYTIDLKNKVFTSESNYIVLDFTNCTGWTFTTGGNCTFYTGYGCTFDTGSYCMFKTGDNCTFTTSNNCTFYTGDRCIYHLKLVPLIPKLFYIVLATFIVPLFLIKFLEYLQTVL